MQISPLSTGSKLLLAAGVLLFLDLFLTWQELPLKYGKRFDVTKSLDGWDRLGLIVGLLTILTLAIVLIRATDVELTPNVPWNLITLGLASTILALTLLKRFTDDGSRWASYAGIVFAALVVVGAYLDRSRDQPLFDEPLRQWKARARPTPHAAALDASNRQSPADSESRPPEPSPRW